MLNSSQYNSTSG